MYTLIMSGGTGTRFWPLSTNDNPKQYLNIVGAKSLIEQTYERMLGVSKKENIFIITVKEQIPLVKKYIKNPNLIIEPMGKNTAPCLLLGLAHLLAKKISPDEIVALVPSDHVILDHKAFYHSFHQARDIAQEQNKIVTIGIKPHFPHTGFGYIKTTDKISKDLHEVFNVDEFREKPDFETATKYLKSGNYYWNAGIFVSSIKTLIQEIKQHAPDYYQKLDEIVRAFSHDEKIYEIYERLRGDSIDYVLMEKTKNIALVKAQFDWNDLGSWDALSEVLEKKNHNIVVASKNFVHIESSDNILYAPHQHVALSHVKDLIIVSTKEHLMILPKSKAQTVKILNDLCQNN